MLFTPAAHEVLTDEPWNAETARTAIGTIVANAESAFDDGWSTHPQDVVEKGDASTRFRTVYCGGAGVVDALHRLARRGFVELRRDYVPYLERSLEAEPDFQTRIRSAVSGRARPESGWCSRGSRRRRPTSNGCRS